MRAGGETAFLPSRSFPPHIHARSLGPPMWFGRLAFARSRW